MLKQIRPLHAAKIICFCIAAAVILRNLWIGDDIFITLRTIDNFVNGYGLVWNAGERVQAFTHPLWLIVLTPAYFVSRSPYLTLYPTTYLISLIVIGLVYWYFAKTIKTSIFATIALISSAAFIDYSSSGLENPLTHLILAATAILLFRRNDSPTKTLFWVSFLASLAMLTRHDMVLFYAPLLLYLLYINRWQLGKVIGLFLAGFLPFILWEAFSTFYYGFPFPNTYYAKVETGLSTSSLIQAGLNYLTNSFEWDPLTLPLIFAGILISFFQKDLFKKFMATGVILYLLYVVYVGGDFMSGRFFSAAYLLSLIILLDTDFAEIFGQKTKPLYFPILAIVLVAGLAAKASPFLAGIGKSPISSGEISNEKKFYFPDLGFLNFYKRRTIPKWGLLGQHVKEAGGPNPYIGMEAIGMFGYYAGPEIYIIDPFTLADPLRARLPVEKDVRIGHYLRRMPEGYPITFRKGFNNRIVNPALHEYYDKLTFIIRGDLFARGRIQEIIRMNLGKYDYLIDEYMQSGEEAKFIE